MPKYHVYGHVVGTKYLGEFEAETPEEAKEMAIEAEEAHVSFCHQCSRECSDPEIHEATVEEAE